MDGGPACACIRVKHACIVRVNIPTESNQPPCDKYCTDPFNSAAESTTLFSAFGHPNCSTLAMWLLIAAAAGQYPVARGCHKLLNSWCASNCPRLGMRGDGNPLLARKLPHGLDSPPTWGCYPSSELQSDGPPHYARLRTGRGSSAVAFCANLSKTMSTSHSQPLMTAEQEGLSHVFASDACMKERALFFSNRRQHELLADQAAAAARERADAALRSGIAMPLTAAIIPQSPAAKWSCGQGTAYVSLLTVSPRRVRGTTFMARLGDGVTGAKVAASDDAFAATQLAMQSGLLLTLIRSVRNVERCRRDYIVLLGRNVTLPPPIKAAFDALKTTFHRIDQLDAAVPPLDKLHAFRLLEYREVALMDSDTFVIRSLDDLFGQPRRMGTFVIAHHGCASSCGSNARTSIHTGSSSTHI